MGQRLFIPDRNTEGYATPTPVGMVVPSPPDEEGRIIHQVEAYQTLSTIAKAYQVSVDTLLNLNGLQIDWPLQIGQDVLINPGRVLSPLEQLTPDGDGIFYHTVKSGETLSKIAGLYEISLDGLMNSNGLSVNAIIRPGQQLRLPVTPPAQPTPTPEPPTAVAATATATVPAPTRTQAPTPADVSPTTTEEGPTEQGSLILWLPVAIVSIAAALIMLVWIFRKFQ